MTKHASTAHWSSKQRRYVNTHGFAALTLVAIAHELGIKLPSLYNHVSGIDDLQGALAAHAANALFLCCQDAAIGRSGDDAIIAIAHAYRDFIHYHHGTYTATLHPQHTENPALVQANQALMQLLARVLGTTRSHPGAHSESLELDAVTLTIAITKA